MIIWFVSITIMFIMLSTNVLSPANTGEIEAATDIKDIKEQHTLPPNFNPQFYEYIHFNKNKTVLDSSLGERQIEHVLKKYNDNQKSYQNDMFLPLKNEEVILITWGYKTQLTNPILRTIIPHPGLVMLFGTLITLLVFLVLFIHHSNKKIQQQVALIKIASQDLATPISTETRIKEFNTSLHAMEELRQSLKSSLSKEWNTQEQRKKDIASLSHDIKTPLTAILGNTELLLEDDITLE